MSNKSFHLGDILSVTTGRLVSLKHIEGVYNILNFMTGESLYTHQLIIASPMMREPIFEQHPWLRNIKVAKDFEFADDKHVYSWLEDMVDAWGEYHELQSREELWNNHDVISDMIKIMNGEYRPND
jgi:hypothetical protein